MTLFEKIEKRLATLRCRTQSIWPSTSQVYYAEKWQQRIQAAWAKAAANDQPGNLREVYNLIQQQHRRSDADSEGALAICAFKKRLDEDIARDIGPPSELSYQQVFVAPRNAAAGLKSNFGSLRVPNGKYFRVGRRDGRRIDPMSGGLLRDAGMATVRTIRFNEAGKEMVGRSGQNSTQIVILTDPPESYSVIPLASVTTPKAAIGMTMPENCSARARRRRPIS